MHKTKAAKILRLTFVALATPLFASCSILPIRTGPEIQILSAQLLTTETQLVDVSCQKITTKGHLLITLKSEVDLVKLNASVSGNLWAHASECKNHQELKGWSRLIPNGTNEYQLLVDYKETRDRQYNLTTHPENICVTVGIGSMAPFVTRHSKSKPYALPSDLMESMRNYEANDGVVEFKTDPTSVRCN